MSLCDMCWHTLAQVHKKGVHWCSQRLRRCQVIGNRLCLECDDFLREEVGQYQPRPGFSKPPLFIVAATKTKTVSRKDALILAICYGNWIAAFMIKYEVNLCKRYHVSELKMISHIESKQKAFSNTEGEGSSIVSEPRCNQSEADMI